MKYQLIIEINIKEKYFIKTILSIINHKLKEYENIKEYFYENILFNNYKIKWIYDEKKNIYYIDTDYDFDFVNDNSNIFFNKLEKHIKNFYHEFGNKWNISLTINKIEFC
jgi:hypothetical protein